MHPHIIEAALNHISGHKAGAAGVYNRSIAALADYLLELVESIEQRLEQLESKVGVAGKAAHRPAG